MVIVEKLLYIRQDAAGAFLSALSFFHGLQICCRNACQRGALFIQQFVLVTRCSRWRFFQKSTRIQRPRIKRIKIAFRNAVSLNTVHSIYFQKNQVGFGTFMPSYRKFLMDQFLLSLLVGGCIILFFIRIMFQLRFILFLNSSVKMIDSQGLLG